jgi:cell division protein FtsI (penicillin-binding protein 3)
MSIGQEVSVTAVQLVTAFAAVANGGRLMQPRIVRALLDPEGREIQRFEPRAVRQVIAPETARTLTDLLTQVVRDGTGRNARIPGYEVAGKTGTAQKLDPATRRYSRAPGVLSFAGFVPADDPRLAMLVLLDEPRTEQWGSEAAAPIFAAIGREALRHLNVLPRDTVPVQIVRPEPPPAAEPATLPLGGLLRPVALGGAVDGVMPDLRGLSLRQALEALAPLDVRLELAGRGVLVAQSPAPGTPLPPGATCRLTLAPAPARATAAAPAPGT